MDSRLEECEVCEALQSENTQRFRHDSVSWLKREHQVFAVARRNQTPFQRFESFQQRRAFVAVLPPIAPMSVAPGLVTLWFDSLTDEIGQIGPVFSLL